MVDNLKAAFSNAIGKYARFEGREPRANFWWWVLVCLILFLIARIADAAVFVALFGLSGDSQPISLLLSLALLLPALSMGARRLHDIGRTGWWLLIALVPILGFLVLIYFYVQPGDPETNQYGAPEMKVVS